GLRAGELAFLDRVLLAAGDGALETRRVAVVKVRLHLLAADDACLVEDLPPQVVAAERAEGVDGTDEERGAKGRERRRPLLERLARLLQQGLERRGIGDLRLARALDDDGLHVLAAQHGAEATAAGDGLAVLPVVGERGKAH